MTLPAPMAAAQHPRAARETLICLHSSASSGRQWNALCAPLGARFELLAPDLLGYDGLAAWPAGQALSLDDEAQHLAPLLDRSAGGAHLLGHSYGAAVALQIALRWPSRVRSLTLYEPVRFALLEPDHRAAAEVAHLARTVGRVTLAGRHHEAAEMFVDYWSGQGSWHRLGERQQRMLALRMPKVRAEFEAVFADAMPAPGYRVLTMPVQLIGGDRSPRPVAVVLDRLAAVLPNARRVTLAGLGHMAPIDAAEQVHDALPDWLRRPPPAAAVSTGAPPGSARPAPRRPDISPLVAAAVLALLGLGGLWLGSSRPAVALAPAPVAAPHAASPGRDPSLPDAGPAVARLADQAADQPPVATF